MATTNAHQSVTAKVHDGGTVVRGGNIGGDGDTAKMTKNLSLADVNGATNDGRTGGRVVANHGVEANTFDQVGIQTVRGAGTLAYFPDARAAEGRNRNFIMRQAGTTNAGRINDVSVTNLHIAAGDVATSRGSEPIHDSVVNRNRGDYSINVLAAPSTAIHPERTLTGSGVAANYVQADDGTTQATDDAATPSRAVPGDLTYHFGGLGKPTTDEYKARNAYEQLDGSS